MFRSSGIHPDDLGVSGTIRAVPNRSPTLAGWLAALALCACGKPTEVELRLYPCALQSGAPMRVTLEIQGYDESGAPAGAALAETFEIPDGVFADDFATVGFRPPDGTVTADFAVEWSSAGAQATVRYTKLKVPALGGSLVLGAEGCEDGATTDASTTDEGTSAGTTTTTGDTSTGDSSSSTGDSSSSTTGDSTTTTTGETTDATSTGTTDATTGDPQEGQPCTETQGALACVGGAGVLGVLLVCNGEIWTLAELDAICDLGTACPAELGLTDPQLTGCIGDADKWTCACADAEPVPCADQGACGPLVDDFVQVEVCAPGVDQTPVRHRGLCQACEDTGQGPLCIFL